MIQHTLLVNNASAIFSRLGLVTLVTNYLFWQFLARPLRLSARLTAVGCLISETAVLIYLFPAWYLSMSKSRLNINDIPGTVRENVRIITDSILCVCVCVSAHGVHCGIILFQQKHTHVQYTDTHIHKHSALTLPSGGPFLEWTILASPWSWKWTCGYSLKQFEWLSSRNPPLCITVR